MVEMSRRRYLVLVAAGVGTAAGIGELTEPEEPAVAIPAVGDVEAGVTGAVGGGGAAPTGDANFAHAATLAGVPESNVVAQLEFVSGDNRSFGVHATYDGALPIHAEGEGYEVAIVDAIGDAREPDTFPQFVFVVGSNRDYGVHITKENGTGQFEQADEFTLAFADTLAAMPAPDILPQFEFVLGANRDYGTHVRTA